MRIDWAGDTLQYVKALAEGSTWHIYITCKKLGLQKRLKNKWVYPNFPPSSENDDDTRILGYGIDKPAYTFIKKQIVPSHM